MWNSIIYLCIAGYSYFVDKHYDTKKKLYPSDSEEIPQFFEIFHEIIMI